MNTPQDSLALRDIHLPEPISWWPPAPGWWLLLAALVLLGLLGWYAWRNYQRTQIQRQARLALHHIRQRYQQQRDDQMLARECSQWLRRVSLSLFPRQQVAGLTGEAWLQWLDQGSDGQAFQQGVGRVLCAAPYAKQVELDAEALLTLCEQWLNNTRHKRRPAS